MSTTNKTSLPRMREDGIHKIEVHVGVVCLGVEGDVLKVLGLHRAPSRSLFPGYWEGVGGQVQAGETLVEAALRHLRDEAALVGEVHRPYDTYVIEPDGTSGASYRIPGVRFLMSVPGTPTIGVDPRQHQGGRWVDLADLESMPWIPTLLPQIQSGVKLFKNQSYRND